MSVLRAENLGKAFRRYHRPADRLREWLGGGVRHERHWAVRGIEASLEAPLEPWEREKGERGGVGGASASSATAATPAPNASARTPDGRARLRARAQPVPRPRRFFAPESVLNERRVGVFTMFHS